MNNRIISFAFYLSFTLLCFGCGGDDTEILKKTFTPEDFVGTWELIKINGKSAKAHYQEDWEEDSGEEGTVQTAMNKIVFASNGSVFEELYLFISIPFENISGWTNVYLGMSVRATIKGSFVVSESAVEFIFSHDNLFFKFDFSWNSDDPDFEREANRILDIEEIEKEWNQDVKEQLTRGLELNTYTFDLEEDLLTLGNGDRKVYRKR